MKLQLLYFKGKIEKKSYVDLDYLEEVYEKWHPPLKTHFEDGLTDWFHPIQAYAC
jgi:DNA-binding MltR family transcriptional regulator